MKKFHSAVLKTDGSAVPNASVTVYNAGTTTKSTIYSDEGVTPKSNPFTSDSKGRFEFYVDDGDFDIEISGAGIRTYKLEDITIVDAKTAAEEAHAHANKAILDAIQQAFTTTLKNKLDGIEDSATADQTATEIRDLLAGLTGADRLALDKIKETDTYKYFTATLKAKLDGIEENANNYSLPTATDTVLGGIKVGDRLSIDAGVLSAIVQSDNNLTNALKSAYDDAVTKAHTQNTDTIIQASGETIDQQQTTYDDVAGGTQAGGNDDCAQTFIAGKTGDLTKIIFRVSRYKYATERDLIVEIRTTDEDGKPTSTVLATKTISSSNFPADTWVNYTWTLSSPVAITSGTKYALVFTTTVQDGRYYIGDDDGSNSYPNGFCYWTDHGEGDWVVYPDRDLYFIIYVDVTTADFINNATLKMDLNVVTGVKIGSKTIEQYQTAVDKAHEHANKTELDKITDGDHDVREDNPHNVTKTQVALGNVPNVDTSIITIGLTIDGSGSAITTGIKADVHIPFACTISEVSLIADQSGSIVIDIWKCTYTQFDNSTHPIDGDSITASAPPTISDAHKSKDTTLTGWTKSISADDVLRFHVDSCTDITRVILILKVTKT